MKAYYEAFKAFYTSLYIPHGSDERGGRVIMSKKLTALYPTWFR